MTPTKICERCGATYAKNKKSSTRDWLRRRFCSPACVFGEPNTDARSVRMREYMRECYADPLWREIRNERRREARA